MTKNQSLENFLYDNDIFCETCKWYTGNTPVKNTMDNVCGHLQNIQSNVYNGQHLRFPGNGMCHRWEQFGENHEE